MLKIKKSSSWVELFVMLFVKFLKPFRIRISNGRQILVFQDSKVKVIKIEEFYFDVIENNLESRETCK